MTKWQKKRLLRNQRQRLRYAARKNKLLQAKTKLSKSCTNITKLFQARKPSKRYSKSGISPNKTRLTVRKRKVKKNKMLKLKSVSKQENKTNDFFCNNSALFNTEGMHLNKSIYSMINNCVIKKKRGRPRKY